MPLTNQEYVDIARVVARILDMVAQRRRMMAYSNTQRTFTTANDQARPYDTCTIIVADPTTSVYGPAAYYGVSFYA